MIIGARRRRHARNDPTPGRQAEDR
jgi:hypothetical protein